MSAPTVNVERIRELCQTINTYVRFTANNTLFASTGGPKHTRDYSNGQPFNVDCGLTRFGPAIKECQTFNTAFDREVSNEDFQQRKDEILTRTRKIAPSFIEEHQSTDVETEIQRRAAHAYRTWIFSLPSVQKAYQAAEYVYNRCLMNWTLASSRHDPTRLPEFNKTIARSLGAFSAAVPPNERYLLIDLDQEIRLVSSHLTFMKGLQSEDERATWNQLALEGRSLKYNETHQYLTDRLKMLKQRVPFSTAVRQQLQQP